MDNVLKIEIDDSGSSDRTNHLLDDAFNPQPPSPNAPTLSPKPFTPPSPVPVASLPIDPNKGAYKPPDKVDLEDTFATAITKPAEVEIEKPQPVDTSAYSFAAEAVVAVAAQAAEELGKKIVNTFRLIGESLDTVRDAGPPEPTEVFDFLGQKKAEKPLATQPETYGLAPEEKRKPVGESKTYGLADDVKGEHPPIPLAPTPLPTPFAVVKPPVATPVSNPINSVRRRRDTKTRRSRDLLDGLNTAANQGTRTAGGLVTGARAIAGTGILGKKAFKFSKSAMAGKIVGGAALADAASEVVTGGINRVSGGIQTAGEVGKKIAQNDGFGAITSAAKGAAGALEAIPVVGKPLAASIGVVTTAFEAAKGVLDSFVDRGRELSAYSGKIASAVAQADASRLKRDIREASTMGDKYARLIIAQEKSEAALQELLMPLKEIIATNLAGLVEGNKQAISDLTKVANTSGNVLMDTIRPHLLAAKNTLRFITAIHDKLVGDPLPVKVAKDPQDDATAQIDKWAKEMADLQLGDGEKERARQADMQRGIGMPALKGLK